MSFNPANCIKETTTSTGTGNLVLAGAVTGYFAFGTFLSNADTCNVRIEEVNSDGTQTGNFEVSACTYNSGGNTITRNTCIVSNNSNAFVNFTGNKTKNCYIVFTKADWLGLLKQIVNAGGSVAVDSSGNITITPSGGFGAFDASPVVQPTALGTTDGFTANASANIVCNESTFTGGTGSSAYTINDIVLALKNLGWLTM